MFSEEDQSQRVSGVHSDILPIEEDAVEEEKRAKEEERRAKEEERRAKEEEKRAKEEEKRAEEEERRAEEEKQKRKEEIRNWIFQLVAVAGLGATGYAAIAQTFQANAVKEQAVAGHLQTTDLVPTVDQQADSISQVWRAGNITLADGIVGLSPLDVPAPIFDWVEGPQGAGKSEAYKALVRNAQQLGRHACYIDLRGALHGPDLIAYLLQKMGVLPRGNVFFACVTGVAMTDSFTLVTQGQRSFWPGDFRDGIAALWKKCSDAEPLLLVIDDAQLLAEGGEDTVYKNAKFMELLLSLSMDNCLSVAFVASADGAFVSLQQRTLFISVVLVLST